MPGRFHLPEMRFPGKSTGAHAGYDRARVDSLLFGLIITFPSLGGADQGPFFSGGKRPGPELYVSKDISKNTNDHTA